MGNVIHVVCTQGTHRHAWFDQLWTSTAVSKGRLGALFDAPTADLLAMQFQRKRPRGVIVSYGQCNSRCLPSGHTSPCLVDQLWTSTAVSKGRFGALFDAPTAELLAMQF